MAQATLKKTKKDRKELDDTTIGWIEQEYNIKVGVRPDMKISTYFRKNGVPSMARFIDKFNKVYKQQQ